MRILFLTDNFPPEVNAPATRTYEHCKEWVKQGAEVTIITCFPNFPQGKVYKGYKNQWRKIEWMDGIKVIRVWSYMSPNKGFFKRLLDFNSFALTSFFAGLSEKKDIVISTSPQFFTSLSGFLLSRKKNVKWIFEVRDLWPESLWMLKRKSFIYKLFSWFEYFFYNKADKIVVVTNSFKNTIVKNGISPKKINVFFNGSYFEDTPTNNKDAALIRKNLKLNDKVILGYIGTFGIAQKLPFFLDLANKLYKRYPSIHLLFIGDGADREEMVKKVIANNIKNITILPPIPKNEVNKYLSAIDFGLVPLRNNPVYHKVIPSKIFEVAAMKKPILLGVEGEVKDIINKYNIGISFKPEDPNDFLEKVNDIFKFEINEQYYNKFFIDFSRKTIALNFFKDIKKLNDEKY